jgi:2-oxo-4-hydroxy-4-carboxy--5-ureidoimidazoline (OHCU) decarboxylase
MSKHTPGPWKAQPREFPEGQWFLEGQWEVVSTRKAERLIAEAAPHIDSDSEEANARLIAAAPELLEALISATRCLAWHVEEQGRGVAMDGVTLERARAAIAKARGGDQ